MSECLKGSKKGGTHTTDSQKSTWGLENAFFIPHNVQPVPFLFPTMYNLWCGNGSLTYCWDFLQRCAKFTTLYTAQATSIKTKKVEGIYCKVVRSRTRIQP